MTQYGGPDGRFTQKFYQNNRYLHNLSEMGKLGDKQKEGKSGQQNINKQVLDPQKLRLTSKNEKQQRSDINSLSNEKRTNEESEEKEAPELLRRDKRTNEIPPEKTTREGPGTEKLELNIRSQPVKSDQDSLKRQEFRGDDFSAPYVERNLNPSIKIIMQKPVLDGKDDGDPDIDNKNNKDEPNLINVLDGMMHKGIVPNEKLMTVKNKTIMLEKNRLYIENISNQLSVLKNQLPVFRWKAEHIPSDFAQECKEDIKEVYYILIKEFLHCVSSQQSKEIILTMDHYDKERILDKLPIINYQVDLEGLNDERKTIEREEMNLCTCFTFRGRRKKWKSLAEKGEILEKKFDEVVYYHSLTCLYKNGAYKKLILSEEEIYNRFSKYKRLTSIKKDEFCFSSDIGSITYYMSDFKHKSTLGVPLEQLRQRNARIYGRLLLGWMQEMRQIVRVQTEYNRAFGLQLKLQEEFKSMIDYHERKQQRQGPQFQGE